jgi:hypothetical protein
MGQFFFAVDSNMAACVRDTKAKERKKDKSPSRHLRWDATGRNVVTVDSVTSTDSLDSAVDSAHKSTGLHGRITV